MAVNRLRRQLSCQQGMALLITIMVVSLLIAVTVQFNRTIRHGYFTAAGHLAGENLMAIARSGLAVGAALLTADVQEEPVDSLLDNWANLQDGQLAGLFNDGQLNLEITDLSGRLQINSLVKHTSSSDMAGGETGISPAAGEGEVFGQGQGTGAAEGGEGGTDTGPGGGNVDEQIVENREILKRLLLSGTFQVRDEQQANEILDALIDWLDPDDQESEFGAESGYYRSLAVPYASRNGPVLDLAELLLVKGITPGLLYGENGRPGLAAFLTVYGSDNRINVNTAPVVMLEALHPLMTEELAELLDDFRRQQEHQELLADAGWYRAVPGFPGDIGLPASVLKVKSSIFQVRSEARVQDQKRMVTAVLERDKDKRTIIRERRLE